MTVAAHAVCFASVRRGLYFSIGVWLVALTALRLTVAAPNVCPPVTGADALLAARAGAAWIENNQHADGSYVYEYNVETGEDIPGYNVVRHAGVTMSLYQFAAEGDLSVMPAADRGLEWMQDNLYEHDDWVALQDPADGSVRLGSSALMLASLVHRRLATEETQYDDTMRQLARGLLVLQLEDGAFLNRWNTSVLEPVAGERSLYATGEAFWTLTLMHRLFPGEGWDEAAWKTADYLALYRDDYEEMDFPPWADQWASYGLGEMADWGLEDHHIDYARSLAGRFGLLVRAESQRDFGDWSRRLHGPTARAAGMGTWVEGMQALHHLATVDSRMADMEAKLAERIECAAGMLVERQWTMDQAAEAPHPVRAAGGWFDEGITRMDDQQHALSGLLYAAPIIEARKRE